MLLIDDESLSIFRVELLFFSELLLVEADTATVSIKLLGVLLVVLFKFLCLMRGGCMTERKEGDKDLERVGVVGIFNSL